MEKGVGKLSEINLVAVTKPLVKDENGNELTAEQFIAYIARVSNPTNQLNNGTANKLLKYMVRNKHWSPFEQVDLTFEIKTTRDIGRQILRHRSFMFQEFSQRYAKVNTEDFEYREARLQDTKNRQNSIETDNKELQDKWNTYQRNIIQSSRLAYEWALDNGIAKEQARVVLPEGMTPTHMYMKGSLRSWITYLMVRTDSSTQKEHRNIAISIKALVLEQFPSLVETVNSLTTSNLRKRLINDLKEMLKSEADTSWSKEDLTDLIVELESL